MLRMLFALMLTAGVAGAAPFTAKEARQAGRDAVEMLLTVNQAFVDESFHTGVWEKCIAANDRLILLRPTDINPYANAAWLLWSTEQTERAFDYYRRMLENNPTNPEGYYIIGHYYFFNRRNYAEALPYLEKAVKFGARPPQNHLYGHCLEKLDRPADALAFWRTLLAADPNDGVAKKQIDKLTAETPAPAGTTPPTPPAP